MNFLSEYIASVYASPRLSKGPVIASLGSILTPSQPCPVSASPTLSPVYASPTLSTVMRVQL